MSDFRLVRVRRVNLNNINPPILVIGPLPPPYFGVSIATEITIRGLKRKGKQIVHLDTSDRRAIKDMGKVDFVNLYLAFYHCVNLFKKLSRFKCDLVYLPTSPSKWGFPRDALFIFIAKLFRAKIVIHLRGANFDKFFRESSTLLRVVMKCSLKLVNIAIVQGDCLRHNFEAFLPSERIKVIPNGLNPRAVTKNHSINSRNSINVLFLGNLLETKGFMDLLRAIPYVLENNAHKSRNITFNFAGEWGSESSKKEARMLANDLKIDRHVRFLGPVYGQEKMNLLADSDIFVYPTYYFLEGHPWVILEAMASGLPIITTDQGCIKESVLDGENGFIINKRSPREIAEKISALMENPDLRRTMGNNSRERFLKYYTEDRFLENLEGTLWQSC